MSIYHSVQPPGIILSQAAIYVALGDIYALEAKSGNIQQHYSVQGLASPTIVNDVIYVNHQHESIIQALSVHDGTQLWSYGVDGNLCFSPSVVAGVVYISTNEGNVYALHANNGNLLWKYKASPLLFASPNVQGDVAYIASAGNSSSQAIIPASPSAQPSFQSSICALQTRDGKLLWQALLPEATAFPLTVIDGSIYISTQNECIALSVHNGSLLWRRKVEGFCRSEPVVMDNMVYISLSKFKHARSTTQPGRIRQWQETSLYALQASDGSPCWQQPLRTEREESSLKAHEPLYEGTDDLFAPLGGDPTVPFVRGNTI